MTREKQFAITLRANAYAANFGEMSKKLNEVIVDAETRTGIQLEVERLTELSSVLGRDVPDEKLDSDAKA